MKKLILISLISLLGITSCKRGVADFTHLYRLSTFTFEKEVINIEVTEDMTSFFLIGTIEPSDLITTSDIYVISEKTSAKLDEHYTLPPGYSVNIVDYISSVFEFAIGVTKSKIEVKINPENIKEPLVLTLKHEHYMVLDEENINEVTINLIPKVKK